MHINLKKLYLLLMLPLFSFVELTGQTVDSAYLFAYFKNNGEDGLHLAWSKDGYAYTALKSDESFLKPAVSKDKLMRDPCIIRGADGLFHMVWTVSWNDKGIGYASSPDLINWSNQQFIPVMAHEPAVLNCWAPEIIYDNGSYMIYWASTIPGRFPAGDSAGDEKYNHRMYFVTTRDFKTFTGAKLLYERGFNVIDATIRKRGSRWFMFLKDETRYPPQKNIRVATSLSLTGPYSEPSAPVTGDYWAEGPTVINKGDSWLMYFDKYTLHQYGLMESSDLVTWKDVSAKLKVPPGLRRGTVFKVTATELDRLLSLPTNK